MTAAGEAGLAMSNFIGGGRGKCRKGDTVCAGRSLELALSPAAFEADDAVSRASQPVRAARAAMAVRAQPARANENLLGPVTAGAFLRTHQFLP